jgi:UDP-N-acetylmuramate dehydrogenase
MQVGGPASYFAEPQTEDDLIDALKFAKSEGFPCFVIGKGSNLIFPDEGYPGLVITMIHYGSDSIRIHEDTSCVTASAGIHLYKLAMVCRDKGLAGAEFLANIPGTLGGALIMNAGFSRKAGTKEEIGPLVEEVITLDSEGHKSVIIRKDLKFSYRRSNLEGKILLAAMLKLRKGQPDAIRAEIQANFDYRNRKQDLRYPSFGSIFKNPPAPNPPAGQLIEESGMKGAKVGGVMISEKHSNYMINTGRGTAADVIQLIQKVQDAVYQKNGILLETEVRIVEKP